MSEKTYRLFQLNKEFALLNEEYKGMKFEVLVLLRKIGRMAKKHDKLCVRYCNEADFNPELIKLQETKILSSVMNLNKELFACNSESNKALIVEFQQDPRGATVRLFLAVNDVDSNDRFQLWEILQ